MEACRLCGSQSSFFYEDKRRKYYRCTICSLVFVPSEFWLSDKEEKAEYDLHENSMDNIGYKNFLMRSITPVVDFFATAAYKPVGLDFGCGPCPLLSSILSSHPYYFSMSVYDVFFSPDEGPLTKENYFDFITMTEVIEHLKKPLEVIERLWSLLKDGGILVIMTKRAIGTVETFKCWHYIRDPTHITFLSEHSFEWLSNHLKDTFNCIAELSFVSKDVVLFHKKKKKE